MNKGSPGGILLIAFGVLFVRLAWTGRIGAVWNALITGESGVSDIVGGGPETDPTKQGAPNSPGNWKCDKARPHAVWGCNGEKQCLTDAEKANPVTCQPANGNQNGVTYMNYNAAGAPYMTAAGNIA